MSLIDRDLTTVKPKSAPGPAPPLVRALRGLYRAYQKTAIYPAGHPSIPQALSEAILDLKEIMTGDSPVLVGVTQDHLLHGQQKIGEVGDLLRSLSGLLNGADVAALEFHPGLELSELETFVHTLSDARGRELKGPGLKEELERRGVAHLRIRPVDYAALSFAQGLHDERQDLERAQDSWETLTRALTDVGAAAEASTLRMLADQVDAKIAHHEGTGAAELRLRVHRSLEQIQAMDPGKRDQLRKRLGEFVTALSPGLRQDLLRVDPYTTEISLRLLQELADDLPAPELLDALERVDSVAGRAPDEFLILMNKLVRIDRENPTETVDIRQRLRDWGMDPESLPEGTSNLRTALEEMFQRRSEEDFNPQDYQVLLEDLSRNRMEWVSTSSAALYRNPADPIDARLQAGELAVALLDETHDDEYGPGIFAYVACRTDLLLDHGKFAAVHDAATIARKRCALESTSEEMLGAAGQLLGEFAKPPRIEKILELASAGKCSPDKAIELLGFGGKNALELALDHLASHPPAEIAEAIEGFALHDGSEWFDQILETRADLGWEVMEAILPMVSRLPREQSIPHLEKLVRNEDPEVRRESLVSLCRVANGEEVSWRHLQRALGDPDLAVTIVAIHGLARYGDSKSRELLARYLEGVLEHGTPSTDRACRVAAALEQSGKEGRVRLARALVRLIRNQRIDQSRLTRWIVDLLARHGELPVVRSALKHWRRSAARLTSLFLPRIGKGPDGAHE